MDRRCDENELVRKKWTEKAVFRGAWLDDDGQVDLVYFELFDEFGGVAGGDAEDAVGEAFVELAENIREDVLACCSARPDAQSSFAPIGSVLDSVSCLFHLMENGLCISVELLAIRCDVNFPSTSRDELAAKIGLQILYGVADRGLR